MKESYYPKGASALLIAMNTPYKGNIGIPVLIWSPPGEGKSSFIESMKTLDFNVTTLIASIHDPTDFSGLPILVDGKVKYAIPEWVEQFGEDGGVLFLDELTTAPPAVQAALLRVVLERTVGFHQLPNNLRIVSAANPPSMMTGGWELTPPLRNRFVHIEWEIPANVYTKALQSGFQKAVMPTIDVAEHQNLLPVWQNKIAAFLKTQPQHLRTDPAKTSGEYAFASPRAWDFVASLMTSCDLVNATKKERNTLLSGTIGSGVAVAFRAFLDDLKLPNVLKVLAGKEKVNIKSLSDAEIYVFFSALTYELIKMEGQTFITGYLQMVGLVGEIGEQGKLDVIYNGIRKTAEDSIFSKALKIGRELDQLDKVTEATKRFMKQEDLEEFNKILIG